ncbi:MAG: hypothetical protein V2I66_15270 [Halieaceae bacterium]|jgi:regulator of replication initiation timing|nr:hypothetical protein [Halieaceae bacterium]
MKKISITAVLALSLGLGGCTQMSGGKPETITLEAHAEETLRLKARIAELEGDLASSRQENARLQAENTELSKRIEMLKVLDQAVEEKRKNYNNQ